MGCLSRIGCLVVLAGAGAAGWWLYGDRFPSEVGRAAGRAADKVGEVAGSLQGPQSSATRRDSTRRTSEAPADRADLAWATITPGATGASILAPLAKRDGPAYVTLGAGQLAAVLGSALPKQLPRSVSDLQIALDGDQLAVRSVIDVSDIAGDGTLGGLLGTALSGRDTLQMAGTLQPLRPGLAEFRIERLRVKGIDVPPRLIPVFMGALRRGPRAEGLAENALTLPLPKTVADLRIAKSRLTLYKAIPTP